MTAPAYPLFPAQPDTAWHRFRQSELADLAECNALPILPVYTLAARSPDTPFDAEERQASPILNEALNLLSEAKHFPVLPPLRHVPPQEPEQVFTLPALEAWKLLEDLIASVAQSGFKRMLVVHANPLLADWLDCGLRDARIATGLDLYRILIPEQAETLARLLKEAGS